MSASDPFGAIQGLTPITPVRPIGQGVAINPMDDPFGALNPTQFAPMPSSQPGGGAYQQILGSAPVQAVSNSWVGQHVINPSIGFLGKVLQPLAAPQQIIFGGLGAFADLIKGDEAGALETWNRSSKAALSYATWGDYNYKGTDPRKSGILGYDLLKKVGAPEQVAKWGGVAADFLLDVPLIGAVGKVSGASRVAVTGARAVERGVTTAIRGVGRGAASMTANVALGARIASYFDTAAEYSVYAGRVAAAPFTTQPIKNLMEGAPSSLKAAVSGPVNSILNARINVPRDQGMPVGPSFGETWIGQNFNVARPVEDAKRLGGHIESQYTVLSNAVVNSFDLAQKGLNKADRKELGILTGRLTDASDKALQATLEGQIMALETRTGKRGLYDRTMTAVGKGISFDGWSAENLTGRGLMSAAELTLYQSGDKRHLRRILAMYGEGATQQIERLTDRDLPGAIGFDSPKLEGFFNQVLRDQGVGMTTSRLTAYHGTSVPFTDFSLNSRATNVPGSTGGLFFAENPKVAQEFAKGKGIYGDGIYDELSSDPGHRAFPTAVHNAATQGPAELIKEMYRNNTVAYAFDPNTAVPTTKLDLATALTIPLDELAFFRVGLNPRVIQHEISSQLLDLRTGGPADLKTLLGQSSNVFDKRALSYIEEIEKKIAANQPYSPNYRDFPSSPGIKDYLAANNLDGIRMRDKGGSSSGLIYDSIYITSERGLNPSQHPSIPSNIAHPDAAQWAGAFKAAYNSTDVHPAAAMKSFLEKEGVVGVDLERIIEGIGGRYAQDLGIIWKPSDKSAALYFRNKHLEGGTQSSSGGRGGLSLGNNPGVIQKRQEITPEYADMLGEVEDFVERIQRQASTVGKLVSRTGVVQDIRKYLEFNGLVELGTVDNLHSVIKNAGLRVVTEDMAEALGQGFQKGEMIPANIHRILTDSTRVSDPGALSAAWQWASSRWQGAKLANPSSIFTNIKSAFVMADQQGMSLPKLIQGMAAYGRLHKGAMRGDGALDTAFKVDNVAMREIFDAGVTHNTMFQREVVDNSNRMLESLANNSAGGIPQAADTLQKWLMGDVGKGGPMVAAAYGAASAPLKWMGDLYGRTDSLFKGGAYMMLRKQGKSPEQAARVADEVFFNYEQGLPYAVDFLRGKNGLGIPISPFASFKFLAAGRFIKNMYERPYQTGRYYRIPSSMAADKTGEEQQQLLAASPNFVKQGLYVFAGKDSEGRTRAIKLDDMLPETVLSDLFNGDNVTGMEPPAFGIARQIYSGQGFQGMPIFKGGEDLPNTMKANPHEAIRGVIKSLWQFGASPLAPGQASTERLIKSLVSKTVPLDQIPDEKTQRFMKFMADGPAAGFNQGVIGTTKQGVQAVPDVVDAFLRYLSVKTTLVTPTSSQPGSARSNLQELDARIKLIDMQMSDEMRQVVPGPIGDGQRREVTARYARMRQPFIDKRRQVAGSTQAP